jgi:molecular chaperone DnaJ
MASVKDLYEVLGVGRDATDDDIKRAYRRLARELHPDVNRHDPQAEERFKEVSAAYEVLSDPAKRRQYDMWGQTGGQPDLFPFGDLTDIFDVFFGGRGGRGRRGRRTRVARGTDLQTVLVLTLEEAAFGTTKDAQLESLVVCDRCAGTGADPGTHPTRCRRCGGSGEIQDVQRSIFGTVMTARPCAQCEGTGEEITDPCTSCRGDGRLTKRQVIGVDVPAGVADGLELRISSGGDAGRSGGMPGDLYVHVQVEPHDRFVRRGNDLLAVLDVPFTLAALGGEVELLTLDGPEHVRIEAGTMSEQTVRLKGRGVPHLGRRGRGDLFVTMHVETPEPRSKEERALIERLAELRGESHGKGNVRPGTLRRPEG